MAFAELLVLCTAMRRETPYLAPFVAASGTDEATRYAETTRWIEWGLQSYFRVLLGVAPCSWALRLS